jgi:pimeloyl-ACP methyl ester carboxylesterase
MAAMTRRGRDAREIVRGRVKAIAAPGWGDAHSDVVEAIVAIAMEAPMPVPMFLAQLQAIMVGDRGARLADITAKTLVVHGQLDPLIPIVNGRRLADAIPGARIVELAGVGHLPMWEADEALGHAIERFFEALLD